MYHSMVHPTNEAQLSKRPSRDSGFKLVTLADRPKLVRTLASLFSQPVTVLKW